MVDGVKALGRSKEYAYSFSYVLVDFGLLSRNALSGPRDYV